jgi:hypothetical protein
MSDPPAILILNTTTTYYRESETPMGWTLYHREPGQTDREHLQNELCGTRHTIIDSTTKGTTFYGACRDNETGEVFAMVVLQQRGRNGRYGYKAMDETVGPFYYDCPERILAALTPTENVVANEWRAKCRAQNERIATRPTVTAGTTIRLPYSLTTADGFSSDTFTYTGRGSLFTAVGCPHTLRLAGWKRMAYTVVTPTTV